VNIIRNALEAMNEAPPPEGGHVLTLEAGPVRLDDGRAMFGLSVTDTGPGIATDTIDRMFNPFFTTRAAGTGLGLAIVHRIVDAHAGRVVVRSRLEGAERGTTFQILLPAAPPGPVVVVPQRPGIRTRNRRGTEEPSRAPRQEQEARS